MILIYCFFIAWFITNFEPLQSLIQNVTDNILQKNIHNKYLFTIVDNIYIVLSCFKCLSLWLTLFVTFNPLFAFIIAFLADTYLHLINKNK